MASAAITSRANADVSPLPPLLLKEARPLKIAKRRRPSIPLEMNPMIRYWVGQFTGPLRDRFAQFMERGAFYQTRIQEILLREGLPPELYYLAMIESGFVTDITSRVGAVGTWQFMSPTARLYGLRTEPWVDERLDVIRSTHAACRYLSELHREFGSWYLAMAAYNAGEGRVRRAIRRGRSRSFWKLVRRGALPAETSQYVPQFQAAMRIARNPRAYGFEPRTLYEYPRLRKLRVSEEMKLVDIAEKARVPYEALRALNRHLVSDRVPASVSGYDVWIPMLPGRTSLARREAAKSTDPNGGSQGAESAPERLSPYDPRSVEAEKFHNPDWKNRGRPEGKGEPLV